MEAVEEYIKEHTRNTYNYNSYEQDPTPWLTTDDAKAVAQIAREETIKDVCDYINDKYEDIGLQYIRGYEADVLIENLKKHLDERH